MIPTSKSLNHILRGIQKKHGDAILRAVEKVTVFSTGLSSFDEVSGIGGIPEGRIVELYSPEGCGKSTFALHCAAAVQKGGKHVVWVDFEQCFTSAYAKKIGLKVAQPDLVLLRPDYAEKGFDAVMRLLDAEKIGLIVIDSIAAAVPQKEFDVLGLGETQIGLQSRVVTGFVKSLNPKIAATNTAVIFINQLRSAISFNPSMSTTQTTPGGRALKFYATLRIHMQMGAVVRGKGENSKQPVAHIVHFAISKNKLAVPYRKTDLMLVHGRGFCEVAKETDEG